jgi:hypothetical protein
VPDQSYDVRDSFTGETIGEDEGFVSSHEPGIGVHYLKAGMDVGREIGLVDDEDVRLGDPRPFFLGILSPAATSIT